MIATAMCDCGHALSLHAAVPLPDDTLACFVADCPCGDFVMPRADVVEAYSYCTACDQWHEDADAENTHHESTGHRATWDERQSFAARRTS